MKKFLITLAISAVVVLGIWTVPEINYEHSHKSKYEESVLLAIKQDSISALKHDMIKRDSITYHSYQQLQEEIISVSKPLITELDTAMFEATELDTAIEEMKYSYQQPEEITYDSKPVDWQALISWIIGSLNGLFGLIIMMKKVFGKTKP